TGTAPPPTGSWSTSPCNRTTRAVVPSPGVSTSPRSNTRARIDDECISQPDRRQPMNPNYDFKGQVALVTGASSGIGLTTAEAFAEAGAAVLLADVNETALREVTDDLTTAGHQALGVACDVSDERQVAAMVERAVGEFGRL